MDTTMMKCFLLNHYNERTADAIINQLEKSSKANIVIIWGATQLVANINNLEGFQASILRSNFLESEIGISCEK